MAMKVIVYWVTKDEKSIAAIRKYFGLPAYTTVNGWTPGTIDSKDIPMFEETAHRGFIRYREMDWTFNGVTYSW